MIATTEAQNDSSTPVTERTGLAALLGIDLPIVEQPSGWENRGPLPYFRGRDFEEHVGEWKLVDRDVQHHTWRLAAIAASLERSSGGRPRGFQKRRRTEIQRFCDAVKVDRQTFHRLSHTYRAIVPLIDEAGAAAFAPDLPFKYYEVVTRRGLACDDPLLAIAEAREKRWSANKLERELERELEARREPTRKRARRAPVMKAFTRVRKMIEGWPEGDQQDAVKMLRDLAAEIESRVVLPPTRPSVLEFVAGQLAVGESDVDESVNDDSDLLDDYYVPGEPELAAAEDAEGEEAPF